MLDAKTGDVSIVTAWIRSAWNNFCKHLSCLHEPVKDFANNDRKSRRYIMHDELLGILQKDMADESGARS